MLVKGGPDILDMGLQSTNFIIQLHLPGDNALIGIDKPADVCESYLALPWVFDISWRDKSL